MKSFKIKTRLKSIFIVSALSTVGSLSAVHASGVENNNTQQIRANERILESIQIAEGTFSGGKAIKVELESSLGDYIYSVELAYDNGHLIDTWIDVQKGIMIGERHGITPDVMIKINKAWFEKVESNTYINLQDAIIKAESESGFSTVRSDFDSDNGKDHYEIDMLDKFGNEHEMHIDPRYYP